MVTLFPVMNQEIILSRKAYYSIGMASELSPHGTGANLVLDVRLKGQIDPETDLVVNLVDVQKALGELHKKIDHKHFQFDVESFSGDPGSHKDIAEYCWSILEKSLKFENAKFVELSTLFGEDKEVLIVGK